MSPPESYPTTPARQATGTLDQHTEHVVRYCAGPSTAGSCDDEDAAATTVAVGALTR